MATGFEDWSLRSFSAGSEEEQEKVDATAVQAVATFSASCHSWRIFNDGPNAIYYSLATGVDTDNFKVPAKSWLMEDVPTTSIYIICAAGETATVYITGVR